MERKYELLTDDTIMVYWHKLFRICASISFNNIEAGEKGGYIESEENLAHEGDAWVSQNAHVTGNVQVSGNAHVTGNAQINGGACVSSDTHYLCISPIGSRNDTITFTRTKEHKIAVAVGCFRGDIDQFEARVKATHRENEHAKAYMLAAQLARTRIDLS